MKIKDGFVLRQVGGQHMVVPVGAQTVDFRCMIMLNETGAFLWERLADGCTQERLLAAMLEEYEVSAKVAKADIDRFIDQLQQADLLI